MNTKTLCFILLFLVASFAKSYAQPYQSIFGQQSTYWIVEGFWGFNLSYKDTISVVKDTIAGNKAYKLIRGKYSIGYGALLREDSNTGKVWYRALYTPMVLNDTTETLIMDLSLQVGDFFDLTYPEFSPICGIQQGYIIDSIYYIGNTKILQFNGKDCHGNIYRFIEGVGGSAGPAYKQSYEMMAGNYLLCAYKDGVRVYLNDYYKVCNPILTETNNQINKPVVQIFPNPTENTLSVEFDNVDNIEWKITNMQGQTALLGIFEKNTHKEINILSLPKGIYSLLLRDKKQIFTINFIKE